MKCKEGQVAFITGGASGIGLGMAKAFASRGMKIAMADIQEDALASAAQGLRADGATVETIQVDVTDRKEMERAKAEALSHFGAVHIVCNNAGVNFAGPIGEISYDDWDWVMGVNLNGVVNGVMTFTEELTKHGADAHFVNTASIGGLLGMRNLIIYNTAKFGVVGLSEALRADLHEAGVGVSVLCPGFVKTNLNSSERNRPGVDAGSVAAPDEDPLAQGMDPVDLGHKVMAAVEAGEFFILPHPEFSGALADKNKAMENAFKEEVDPAAVELVRSFTLPY